jgi:hypothetical protein
VVEVTMDVQSWLRKQLEEASPDLLREMAREFAEALMGAEAASRPCHRSERGDWFAA